MKIYAATKRGSLKSKSEDRIVIGDIILNEESRVAGDISPSIIGIADGVGGTPGGDLAAQFVCEGAASLTGDDLLSKTAQLNGRLLKFAQRRPDKINMAATFSAIVFGSPNRIIHIGNTRIYAVYNSSLIQLTSDHTTFNRLLRMGLFDAAEKCNKCEITNCFGGGTASLFAPDIGAVIDTETLIFTSDGIHDHLSNAELENFILSDLTMEQKADSIMSAALNNGSHDDMSIVIAENIEISDLFTI